MRNLMEHLRQKGGLDVTLQTEPILLGDADNVADFKFFYMHGRTDFRIGDDGIANLRANLQTGGLLLADACCGKKAFDRAFRAFIEKVFPDQKLERIPLTDDLFSKDLNGEAIKTVRCRVEGVGGAAEKEYKDVALSRRDQGGRALGSDLQQIRPGLRWRSIDNAWGTITPALKLAGAVLYALKR